VLDGAEKVPSFMRGAPNGAPTQSSQRSTTPSPSASGSVGVDGGGQSSETPSQASAVSQAPLAARQIPPAGTGVLAQEPAPSQALDAQT